MADTPPVSLANLPGKTDANNALVVYGGAATTSLSANGNLFNLKGCTSGIVANALVVQFR